ncbi:Usher syndrome type-1G protein [Dermatophagoides pteronyssinus]|uniref:Usher syndrome type-1G protein n=1 Tax=Dermatophagoides pteronyssinus TaxID=6956 RepID=A0ABQ8IVX6_DERPT|nr:Usher syndrome type-1G protein [Dermatophagoides pteronyssinus]
METSAERLRQAVRDGYLEILRNATRKECNHPDDDGMTATHWASYSGHLNALRIIVGRGGDPEKCDNFGNTALHWAAQNGHIKCVSFLISFGVNLWSMDNEYHTAKEVAALNNRNQIVDLIDHVVAQQSALNSRTVIRLKEKARIDAEKRIKLFRKLQQKTIRQAEKDERKKREKNFLMKRNLCLINTNKAGSTTIIDNNDQQTYDELFNIYDTLDMATKNAITRSQLHNVGGGNSNVVPKFSDLVNGNSVGGGSIKASVGTKMPKILSGVSRKVLTRKLNNSTDTIKSNSTYSTIADGTCRSTQSMMVGIRRDDHIVYVPKFNSLSVNDLLAATGKKSNDQRKEKDDDKDTVNEDCSNNNSYSRLPLKDVFDDNNRQFQSQQQQKTISSTIQRRSTTTTNKLTSTFNRNNIKTTLKNKLLKLNRLGNDRSSPSSTIIDSKTKLIRARSEPDFLQMNSLLDKIDDDDDDKIDMMGTTTSSIFERPGFGSVSFRGKFTPDLMFSTTTTTNQYDDDDDNDNNGNESDDSGQDHNSNGSNSTGGLNHQDIDKNNDIIDCDLIKNNPSIVQTWPERDSITSDSIGSAGSLVHTDIIDFSDIDYIDDHIVVIDNDDNINNNIDRGHEKLSSSSSMNGSEKTTISVLLFLYANDLKDYYEIFENEQIDIDTLMMLEESDLKSLGIPFGPRKKLMTAINQRRKILSNHHQNNNYKHNNNDEFDVFETRL